MDIILLEQLLSTIFVTIKLFLILGKFKTQYTNVKTDYFKLK